ncbi:DUF177 domain-containing protein [Xanthobacter dioxanivorans]|uniref:DUF177 domain-containing protein n=1 Tax=Xanthobacter dioxanivorans TaxID=2528964 RepID=A0A974PLM6_9HYPH|nr:DUF177 domain-containing protein [Xanthobacter dioxanivorans]QRG05464.1 DUF177 domain-containing protein [Xanthobacter dioxanivorans]
MSDLPFSQSVRVVDLPPHGLDLKLAPDARTCHALASYAGVLAVSDLAAQLHFDPERADGVHVTGRVTATVRQTCGVTLEPFDAPLSEEIDVHFVPAGSYVPKPPAPGEEDDGEDPPDEIVDGAIDAGALLCEFLVLGVDPYPRKPGAVFEAPATNPAEVSPFAALARLKDPE